MRQPPEPQPAAHLQLRGTLRESHVLRRGQPLERVHFPTSRVSLEAVIRLLAEDFGVRCNTHPELWRPLLAESEATFLGIARREIAGSEG